MSGRFGSSSLPLQTVVLGFLHSRHSIIHALIQWPLGDFPGGLAAFTALRNSLFEHLFSYLGAFSCTSFHVTNAIHILLGYSYLFVPQANFNKTRTHQELKPKECGWIGLQCDSCKAWFLNEPVLISGSYLWKFSMYWICFAELHAMLRYD